MKRERGIVAAGHEMTAQAAAEILKAGGNAFDATLGAIFASCVAEPVLASLGGGGFLLASTPDKPPLLYDFFTQTPRSKAAPEAADFYPIVADFGTAQQEFHIGMGSIATPGVIKGAFHIHRALCRMPLRTIIEPACEYARSGIIVNSFQHYISEIVSPIILSSPAALALYATKEAPNDIAKPGEIVCFNHLADAFENLEREGSDLFYFGEMGRQLVEDSSRQGGYLRSSDLRTYQVVERKPLELSYHRAHLYTNPAPSVGGTLIAVALSLLESEMVGRQSPDSLLPPMCVAFAQKLTQQLRLDHKVEQNLNSQFAEKLLSKEYLRDYHESMRNHAHCFRGTTQISVADSEGNMASMTLSNGEGSGYVLPGTGIMLNNMLGEEDINPHGFHNWPEDRRIASMMSPTLVHQDNGQAIATGSGGSNRIRSAILQVLVNLLDFGMSVDDAVEHPRLHFEGDLLNLEYAADAAQIQSLLEVYPNHRLWPEKNLFFGGAHTVVRSPSAALTGKGDSRRGGVCISV